MDTVPSIRLNDGLDIPCIGLGVFMQQPGPETYNAVKWALETGYRLVDTAKYYGNEQSVGEAIRDSKIPREEIFVTTKFWPFPKHGYDACMNQVLESLDQLGMSYIDLVLIHSPGNAGDDRMGSWKALETLKDQKKVRSIGVSNYGVHHLEELKAKGTIAPTVNQVEVNPYIQRKELHDYCRANGIVMMAYSPLTKGIKLNDPKLVKMAKKNNCSPAQLLIRWCVESEMVVIPKSSKKIRIEENFDVFGFALDKGDRKELDTWDEYLVTGWDPTTNS